MTATVAGANRIRSLTQAVAIPRTPAAPARRLFAGFLSALLRALAVAAA
jgi:hypothetical protein